MLIKTDSPERKSSSWEVQRQILYEVPEKLPRQGFRVSWRDFKNALDVILSVWNPNQIHEIRNVRSFESFHRLSDPWNTSNVFQYPRVRDRCNAWPSHAVECTPQHHQRMQWSRFIEQNPQHHGKSLPAFDFLAVLSDSIQFQFPALCVGLVFAFLHRSIQCLHPLSDFDFDNSFCWQRLRTGDMSPWWWYTDIWDIAFRLSKPTT